MRRRMTGGHQRERAARGPRRLPAVTEPPFTAPAVAPAQLDLAAAEHGAAGGVPVEPRSPRRAGRSGRRWVAAALLGAVVVAGGVTIGMLVSDLAAARDEAGRLDERAVGLQGQLAAARADGAEVERAAASLDAQLRAVSADRDRSRLAAQAARSRDAERVADGRAAINALNDSSAAFTRQALADLALSMLGVDPGEPGSVASQAVDAATAACLATTANPTA